MKIKFTIYISMIFAILFILNSSIFALPPKLINADIMPLSEVKRGMVGIGYTVFDGMECTEFKAEILGVLNNQNEAGSYIIGKFESTKLESTGVIAGMSGSPVYINGKLIGAVCATYPFTKEPIGFIRPIESMLETLTKPTSKPKREETKFIPLEVDMASKMFNDNPSLFSDTYKTFKKNDPSITNSSIVPVRTPLFISGIDSELFDLIDDELSLHGYVPMLSGNVSSDEVPKNILDKKIEGGDAIALALSTGDIGVSAVGTVTYCKDDDILIFGHHAFSSGILNAPLFKAMIYYSIPNYNLSFKVASPLNEIGATTYDGKVAVAGKLGKKAEMVPVNISVDYNNKKKFYNVNVIQDSTFLPNVAALAIMQAVLDVEAQNELDSMLFDINVEVKNLTTGEIDNVKIEDYWTGQMAAKNLFQGVFNFIQPLQYLIFNFYNPVQITSIKADIKIKPNVNFLNITSVEVLNDELHPGDIVKLRVTMQNYQKEEIIKDLEMQIPSNINVPNLLISVGSAKLENSTHSNMIRELYTPHNYKQLIEILNARKSFDELVVWMDIPRPGLIINDKVLPNIPENVLFLYGDKNKIGNISLMIDRKTKRYKTNYLVNGMMIMPLIVDLEPRIE